jgi:sigma-B regulation protein RsbU (phosphoserine phosphatase)
MTEGLRILAVDDDAATRLTLSTVIADAGWSPVVVDDPEQAYQLLIGPDAPPIALIDWQMPSLSGLELCRRIRAAAPDARPYIIFVTVNSTSVDIVTGLDAGADGYMTKPIAAIELQARVRAGLRTIALQQDLRSRLHVAQASAESHRVPELLPMCCYCHRVRDEREQWSTLEQYVMHRDTVRFTHGFCPDCYDDYVRPDMEGGG